MYKKVSHVLGLVYCGSYEFEGRSPQYTSRRTQDTFLSLVYFSGAAVGVDARQYKPFYTAPKNYANVFVTLGSKECTDFSMKFNPKKTRLDFHFYNS